MRDRSLEVERAKPDRVGPLASVFGRAFVGEPMTAWSFGAHGDAEKLLTAAFSIFLERVLGLGLVWEIVGREAAAVWVPPGGLDGCAVHPWSQPQIAALAQNGSRRYDTFWDWVDSHQPTEPVWLLDSVAVDPSEQGRGLGAALVSAGLEMARAAGLGAFLSTATERNVQIYQRCGFDVVEVAEPPDGGPTVYFMRSDA